MSESLDATSHRPRAGEVDEAGVIATGDKNVDNANGETQMSPHAEISGAVC
jgi:hypothetical protein